MPEEKSFVRRIAGPNREVGLVFAGAPDGAGGEWATVEWSGRNEHGRRIRLRHRPSALEWLD